MIDALRPNNIDNLSVEDKLQLIEDQLVYSTIWANDLGDRCQIMLDALVDIAQNGLKEGGDEHSVKVAIKTLKFLERHGKKKDKERKVWESRLNDTYLHKIPSQRDKLEDIPKKGGSLK
tara:strand:+ start:140 stop:496 length:357 start_codon:yes stop_codon:yes gene_type:complete